MTKKVGKNSIIEVCPIRNVVARFGSKWALLIIHLLNEQSPVRFNQLGKLIPDISTKMLAGTLQTLEADGLVRRTVFPEVPIRVEYELTPLGRSLVPLIQSLTAWAQEHMPDILAHRKRYARHRPA